MANPNDTAVGNEIKLLDDYSKIGREGINASFPDEIEYYACAFELLDGKGSTLQFFSFPIMPQTMSENKSSITNIKKTNTGVVVTTHSTFVPFDIPLAGHFGRTFRKISNVKTDFNKEYFFSSDYKTGYGCIKILEGIFKQSTVADSFGNPVKLLFYNLSLNSHHMVEILSFNLTQNKDMNMIWQYNINMKAVAPAKSISNNYTTSIKALRSYAKKNMKMNQQIIAIEEEIVGGDSVFKQTLRKIQSTALGQSAFSILVNETQSVIENSKFLAKIGKNITLNHLQSYP